MSKIINVKLHEEKDKDIIKFLEEKNATTFIVREALRMYIKAYENISAVVTEETKQQPAKVAKLEKFKQGLGQA